MADHEIVTLNPEVRFDLIGVVVPERPSTPLADILADPFLSALWLPTVTVNARKTWPLRPLVPTVDYGKVLR